ncbi:MAG TPA: hypothetical protein VG102_02460 [Candidatus Paceibacterota bacterium]|jgi:hypothetical protein|nr:hypothetical protein [Candidatus Paceibacterota bacterium]
MNKYFVMFRIPLQSMDEWAKNVSSEERKKQSEGMMQDWKKWQEKNKNAIVDNGSPLGKTKRVSKDGIKDERNDLNYCMVIQAASHDEAAKIIAGNPHLQIPTSFVDVMEIPHTGM